MKATAIAHSNIALIKYWGKRALRDNCFAIPQGERGLILPYNNSISVTLDNLSTHTTVEFSEHFSEDTIILNNEKLKQENAAHQKICNHLKLILKYAPLYIRNARTRVESVNNFPTASGLASSASGFAALTMATCNALNLKLSQKELSILARQGSGSASRSIFGGFVEWEKGFKKNGSDSFAQQLFSENHWPEFKVLVVIVETKEKEYNSRDGMEHTVKTSPFYQSWIDTVEDEIKNIKVGITKKDFTKVGEIAEHNCLKMHATMHTARPALCYWQPATIKIMHEVWNLRKNGIECYFTIDAGPQVKVLCEEKNLNYLKNYLSQVDGVKNIIACSVGGDTFSYESRSS